MELLKVEGLTKHFPVSKGFRAFRNQELIRAVDDITFSINEKETVGLVGESGCGKTTVSKLILLLEQPTRGRILFKSNDISKLNGNSLNSYRRAVQAVFQDPYSSLNPRMRIRDSVAEPLLCHGFSKDEAMARVNNLLISVGLDPNVADCFPHEFSGGQRQRIAVARAISLHPELIVLDEPVSALDVSLRSQVMNLLQDLQIEYGHSYLLIAHSMAVIRYMCTVVAVMYLGKIVEYATRKSLFEHTKHPYTQALLSAALPISLDSDVKEILLEGEVPSPIDPPPGCHFHPRCFKAWDRCAIEAPILREIEPEHQVACHLYE
ncbi:ABC transporter ATP-binding protein [Chloroflexota bacterium]